MRTRVHLDGHTIFGTWSGEHGNQVLVSWDPIGFYCDVFLMSGSDYGGGIDTYREMVPVAEIDALDTASETDYAFYDGIKKLIEATP